MSIQAILASTYYGAGGGGSTVGDFTIEWWQKVEDFPGQNSRPWSVGLYPTQILSLSYEGLISDYFWMNNYAQIATPQIHVGQGWRHMAYVRSSGVLRGYINGTQYTADSNSSSPITDTSVPLYVGTGEISAGMFKGYITNLHIIKGVAKYTGNFTTPTLPVAATPNSVMLLAATNELDPYADSTIRHGVVSASGDASWSSDTPFTAVGPYSQYSNSWSSGSGSWTIDFAGGNYNADLLNVKTGWTVSDGSGFKGTVIADAVDLGGNYIRIGVNFDPAGPNVWTFTQPALGGSLYFDGSSYLNYGASVDWAMDAY